MDNKQNNRSNQNNMLKLNIKHLFLKAVETMSHKKRS